MSDQNIPDDLELHESEINTAGDEENAGERPATAAGDETVGTGSFIAVGCSLITLAFLLVAIAIFMIRQAT